jgi:hypothetical protein
MKEGDENLLDWMSEFRDACPENQLVFGIFSLRRRALPANIAGKRHLMMTGRKTTHVWQSSTGEAIRRDWPEVARERSFNCPVDFGAVLF